MDSSPPTPSALVDRIVTATNRHDLDALVDCFAQDYVNETPVHPTRGFTGREQVRRNWSQLFSAMPDLRCRVLARAVDGDDVWSQWEMRGTRHDGSLSQTAGVIVFTVVDGRAQRVRFILEPVDTGTSTVDDAVAAAAGPAAAGSAAAGTAAAATAAVGTAS